MPSPRAERMIFTVPLSFSIVTRYLTRRTISIRPDQSLRSEEFNLVRLGAPAIIKDKTFIYGTYEGVRQNKPGSQSIHVPTDAERALAVPAVAPYLKLWPEAPAGTPTDSNGITQTFGVALPQSRTRTISRFASTRSSPVRTTLQPATFGIRDRRLSRIPCSTLSMKCFHAAKWRVQKKLMSLARLWSTHSASALVAFEVTSIVRSPAIAWLRIPVSPLLPVRSGHRKSGSLGF